MPGVPTIRRTNNPADYFLVDGVVIDERRPPSGIVGLSGNKVCVVGEFERGPIDVVTQVGSSRELFTKFGGVGPDANGAFFKGALSLLGKAFPRLYIVRISNATQTTSKIDVVDSGAVNVIDVIADSPGDWGDSLAIAIEAATDGVAGHFNLKVYRSGAQVEFFRNLDLTAYAVGADLTPDSEFVRTMKMAAGNGRPANLAVGSGALTGGADGTFADADYTGSPSVERGIQVLYGDAASDIRWVYAAETFTANVNAALLALAASQLTVKYALIAGAASNSVAQMATDVALYRSDHVGYCYPHGRVYVAEANAGKGGLVQVGLNSFAAVALASIAPGENPAGPNGERFLSGIRELTKPNLTTADYATAREQGVMMFQFTKERQLFSIRSGITSSVDQALKNWARRTMADFLQESIALYLVTFQNKALNNELKLQVKSAIADFMDLQIANGILPSARDLNENRPVGTAALSPYEIDIASLNSPSSEALGLFIIKLKVRIFSTADFIVLRTEIGERVEVTLQAA